MLVWSATFSGRPLWQIILAQAPGAATGVAVTAKPATPTITLLNPSSGAVGASVTITGSGFNAAQGNGTVTFNGAAATVTSWSVTSLVVTVPAVATTGNVLVFQNGVLSAGSAFTVTGASATNPISASRDASAAWAVAGVESGIPSRTSICTTLGTPGQVSTFVQAITTTQINTAITNCASGSVVMLSTGTYNFASGGIALTKSHVVLRGQGANATKLIFSGNNANICNYFDTSAVALCGGAHYGTTGQFGHSGTWSGGYTAGTSTIQVSDKTGMAVGSPIALDQLDDASDGFPAAGDVYVCTASFPCSNQGGGFNGGRDGRSLLQITKVTSVEAGSCTTTGNLTCDIGIDPSIYGALYRAGRTPQVWWSNAGTYIEDIGIEDLSIDNTASAIGGNTIAVFMSNCMNCWAKGLRVLMLSTTSVQEIFQFGIIGGFHDTIESSYLYGNQKADYHCNGCAQNQNYSITILASSSILVQNNIFQRTPAGVVFNGPTHGSVVAYNYVRDASYTSGGTVMHGVSNYNLHEGNDNSGVLGDVIHAPHYFETVFRNFYSMNLSNGVIGTGGINVDTPFALQTHSRFWNIIGNVAGEVGASPYEVQSSDCGGCIYKLGWQSNDSPQPPGNPLVANDGTRVSQTLFRWGNYDTVSAASRFVTAEVPTGITNFPNALPASQLLPPTLYLSGKPLWFQSLTYPPIGPDVSGGNIAGYGGHAFKIPARVCSDSSALMPDDPAYAGTTVRTFDRVGCYGS